MPPFLPQSKWSHNQQEDLLFLISCPFHPEQVLCYHKFLKMKRDVPFRIWIVMGSPSRYLAFSATTTSNLRTITGLTTSQASQLPTSGIFPFPVACCSALPRNSRVPTVCAGMQCGGLKERRRKASAAFRPRQQSLYLKMWIVQYGSMRATLVRGKS